MRHSVDTLSYMCVTTHSHTFPLALVVSLRWHVVGMMSFCLVDLTHTPLDTHTVAHNI